MSQMVKNSNVTGTNLFWFLFQLKWFGMNEILQNISVTENELCFCFQFGIRIGTALSGGKPDDMLGTVVPRSAKPSTLRQSNA